MVCDCKSVQTANSFRDAAANCLSTVTLPYQPSHSWVDVAYLSVANNSAWKGKSPFYRRGPLTPRHSSVAFPCIVRHLPSLRFLLPVEIQVEVVVVRRRKRGSEAPPFSVSLPAVLLLLRLENIERFLKQQRKTTRIAHAVWSNWEGSQYCSVYYEVGLENA